MNDVQKSLRFPRWMWEQIEALRHQARGETPTAARVVRELLRDALEARLKKVKK